MNRSISRFLDDLDRRDEERRKDLIKTLKQAQFEGEKVEEVLGESVENQEEEEDE
jgi:hypothetical protein